MPARPRYTMTVRLPEEVFDRLVSESVRAKISQNEVVVRALESALASAGTTKPSGDAPSPGPASAPSRAPVSSSRAKAGVRSIPKGGR